MASVGPVPSPPGHKMADMDRVWSTEEARWIYPGEANAAVLKVAFTEAIQRCASPPYLGSADNGDEALIDGFLPEELWGHMAVVLRELAVGFRSSEVKP